MAKGRGWKCPFCKRFLLHIKAEGSYRECDNCGFVGWWLADPVKPGQGLGYKCANCQKSTLHYFDTKADLEIFRCSKCLYSGTRAKRSEVGEEAP